MPDEIPGQNDTAPTDAPKDDDAPKTPEEQLAELAAKVEATTAHSRKWEKLAKENKKAADELAALKAANATPDEQREAAQREAAEARAELARYRVVAETGLPVTLASLLNGDEDAMREQATALIEFRSTATPPPKTPVVPDPSQGPRDRESKPTAADEGRAAAQARIARRSGKKS